MEMKWKAFGIHGYPKEHQKVLVWHSESKDIQIAYLHKNVQEFGGHNFLLSNGDRYRTDKGTLAYPSRWMELPEHPIMDCHYSDHDYRDYPVEYLDLPHCDTCLHKIIPEDMKKTKSRFKLKLSCRIATPEDMKKIKY